MVIGLLSILSGIYMFFYKDRIDAFYGFFIGIVLISSFFLSKIKIEKDETKK